MMIRRGACNEGPELVLVPSSFWQPTSLSAANQPGNLVANEVLEMVAVRSRLEWCEQLDHAKSQQSENPNMPSGPQESPPLALVNDDVI